MKIYEHTDPYSLFEQWLKDAMKKEKEPTAMVLSTCVNDEPSSRVVLMKKHDKGTFGFFTNYNSPKAESIQNNQRVSLLFYWPRTQRQVRITGLAYKMDVKSSDEYWETRPFLSRVASTVSSQSDPMPQEDSLWMSMMTHVANGVYKGRPWYWGGYDVHAVSFDFMEMGIFRMHDRVKFSKIGTNEYSCQRLYP